MLANAPPLPLPGWMVDALSELLAMSPEPLDVAASAPTLSTTDESSTGSSSSRQASTPMTEQEAKRERQRAKERDKARRAYKRKMVRLFKGDARETGVCLV